MMMDYECGKDVVRSSNVNVWYTVLEFVWRKWRKSHQDSLISGSRILPGTSGTEYERLLRSQLCYKPG